MQIVNLMTPDPITIGQHDTLSKAKTTHGCRSLQAFAGDG